MLDAEELVARQPRAEEEVGVPWPCPPLKRYEPPGKHPFWECRLPKGKVYLAPDATIPRNARRRIYRPGLRTEAHAKEECLAWLWQANDMGAFD